MLLQPGTHFAQHRIVRRLGIGRMGEVYEVIAPDGLRRALKIIKAEHPLDSKPQARGGQEAETIASLEHVHIVRYLDCGIEHGRVWILMELVEGTDLRQLVTKAGGRLPVEQAVRIVRQACEGMAAAHAMKMVHRDLKPDNLLIGADDLTKVADFGSVKLEKYGVKTTTDADLTSCFYMAPEAVKPGGAGPASDVFALGVVLHELVTGENPLVTPSSNVMTFLSGQLPEPPSPQDDAARALFGDLAALVARARAKDPALRPTMKEMAEALAVLLHRLTLRQRYAARSLPLPNRAPALAMTEPAMPAFHLGATMPMAAFGAPPAPAATASAAPATAPPAARPAPPCHPASIPDAERDALPPPAPSGVVWTASPPAPSGVVWTASPPAPPAPSGVVWSMTPPASGVVPTLRSPVHPPTAIRATDGAEPLAERGSTSIPVERSQPPRPATRGLLPIAASIAVLALAGGGAGWLFLGHRAVAPASAPPPPTSSASAPPTAASAAPTPSSVPASSAAASATPGAPRPKAPAAPASPGTSPQRSKRAPAR
jgi:serine/threonine-protein kinase